MHPTEQHEYWQAVLARDNRYDGRFVYAVQSTGIYCRPSCPSRRPRADRVAFFAAPAEAEQAGFRACRRCRPDLPAADERIKLVQRICSYIDLHLDAPLRLDELGALVGVSPFHLQRLFRQVAGISPRQYVEAQRMARLKQHLRAGDDVTGAIYDAGFASSSRVYERAATQLGMRPGEYRAGGVGITIGYTTAACVLGQLLLAGTERGICAVRLGDDAEALAQALPAEFPAATIVRDDQRLLVWVEAVLRYLDGREPHLDLPLDVRATAFQWIVWEALRAIPYGETRSYGEVATAIGRPAAARAVAQACAANPVALVVPCHRVVRSDGDIGGYRWGKARKRSLLQQERGE
ncbi:MAG TPA: bifunctional DNA-binding transcriptional regulator/O6-methylguanine-DNA methyltransferase Ada [Roseiflexaceae bacterium]|nr:bifunctional DNA-binding transcriptional regulator/O6-methylguanine-DNA methyltransferase Ada [Roseiflexaceae bacterium]HMP39226.1 bifunctional DNA-binding transcriptional regulator/O6-methylguanine-DNA methyltransferase Ada [Roseiflexaceae bacterium]